jgi:hypothetical protein
MALTDTAIRNLKSEPEPYKKSDSEGLYLLVTPEGSKSHHKLQYLRQSPLSKVTTRLARATRPSHNGDSDLLTPSAPI